VLSRTVGDLLAAAETRGRSCCRGVVAPHAGYAYSGAVAAQAFASVRGSHAFKRAIVIGPTHYVPFRGIAAPSAAAFATPIGEVAVEAAAIERLKRERLVVIDDLPHTPEHAIEVELPFLQAVLPHLPIVPLLCGSTSPRAVAAAIGRTWTEDTLLVVSTDLSHFEDYRTAREHDKQTAAAIEAFDQEAIGPLEACGHLALRGALIEAARRGLDVERLALRNSGDVTGDRASVVGYGAWVFYGSS
jgi:AmmeMemoRadiSam system protein B